MKNHILSAILLGSFSVSASEAVKCTEKHLKMLDSAEGSASATVDSVIHAPSTEFSSMVTPIYKIFPQDCGRFTFIEYRFAIKSDNTKLSAVVHAGGLNCTSETRTMLIRAKVIC